METENLNEQLIRACKKFSYGKIRQLVKKGADPNTIINEKGRTAFNWAAWHCANKTLECMLKAGADIKSREKEFGDTPLLSACASGCRETVEILLEAGSDIKESANDKANGLMYAVLTNRTNMITFLCDKGIDINAQDNKGHTALMYVISKKEKFLASDMEKDRKERLKIINILLKNGADINIQDSSGYTPLIHAVFRGNIDIIKLLLENGANFKAPKKNILMYVDDIPSLAGANKDEVTWVLKSYGAKIKPYFARYKINVNCKECGKLIPLNGPVQQLKCNYCSAINELNDEFWEDILNSYCSSVWSREDTYNAECELCNPRCIACNTELDIKSFNNSEGEIKCPKCGKGNLYFPAPEWFRKFGKYNPKPNMIISGLSVSSDSEQNDDNIKPVAIRCVSCSATMSITVDTPRNCTCEHCGAVQYLPDPVWKVLHPVKIRKNWYIYYTE